MVEHSGGRHALQPLRPEHFRAFGFVFFRIFAPGFGRVSFGTAFKSGPLPLTLPPRLFVCTGFGLVAGRISGPSKSNSTMYVALPPVSLQWGTNFAPLLDQCSSAPASYWGNSFRGPRCHAPLSWEVSFFGYHSRAFVALRPNFFPTRAPQAIQPTPPIHKNKRFSKFAPRVLIPPSFLGRDEFVWR